MKHSVWALLDLCLSKTAFRCILFSTSAHSFDSSSHFVLATPWTEHISQGIFWIASPISKSVASNTDTSLTCSKRIWAAGKAPFPLKVRLKKTHHPYHIQISSKMGSTDEYMHIYISPPDHLMVLWKYLQCHFTTIWATNPCWSFRQDLVKQDRISTPNSSPRTHSVCSAPTKVSRRICIGSGISFAR